MADFSVTAKRRLNYVSDRTQKLETWRGDTKKEGKATHVFISLHAMAHSSLPWIVEENNVNAVLEISPKYFGDHLVNFCGHVSK